MQCRGELLTDEHLGAVDQPELDEVELHLAPSGAEIVRTNPEVRVAQPEPKAFECLGAAPTRRALDPLGVQHAKPVAFPRAKAPIPLPPGLDPTTEMASGLGQAVTPLSTGDQTSPHQAGQRNPDSVVLKTKQPAHRHELPNRERIGGYAQELQQQLFRGKAERRKNERPAPCALPAPQSPFGSGHF